jgi:Flp pilus assembly protein TadB
MAERKRLVEDAAARALVAAGKDAAKRAADDLLSSEDERSSEELERKGSSKRWKLIGIGLLALFLVVGVIGMVMSYWPWFLLAGVVGLAGAVGWRRLSKRRAAKRAPRPTLEARIEPEKAAALRPRVVVADEPQEAEKRVARELEEAQAVDEELAAMKARLGR